MKRRIITMEKVLGTIKNFLGRFHLPQLSKKSFFSLITVFFLVLGLGVGIFLVQKNQDVRKKAVTNPATVTLIPVSPAPNVEPGVPFSIDVFLNQPTTPPAFDITAAGLFIGYSDKLTLTNISPVNFFVDNFVQNETEMMALGISCNQATDCTKYTTATNITCLNNFCQNSLYPLGNTATLAKIYLGASCHVTMPTDGSPGCHTENTTKKFATLTFSAKAGTSGAAEIWIDSGSLVTAKNNTDSVLISTPLPDKYALKTINITPATGLCGNGFLDSGEVCDKAKNCITGKTSGGTDGLGCVNACIGGSDGYHGYPNNGRNVYCKDDCSGYDNSVTACWDECTSNPTNTTTSWGTGSLFVGETCPTGGTINDQCVCVTTPSTATLNFTVKFQGTPQEATKKVKVTLTGTNPQVFTDVPVTKDAQGLYSGVITNIAPGTYNLLVKGPVHLQKNFGSVIFEAGQTLTKNCTDFALIIGDTNNDNWIKMNDLTGIIAVWNSSETPVNDQNRLFDLDENNVIALHDITSVISNWTQSEREGEK